MSEQNEIVVAERHETGLAQHNAAPSIGAILQSAMDKGIDPESLEKLVAVYERMADRQAAQEFAQAMAAFQNECPEIRKDNTATIVSAGKGTKYSYKFADLDTIAKTVRPLLQKHGLSYSWDSKMEGSSLSCTCIIRHINGHSATATFACPTESSAGMSAAQKHAAALTFARRQSLVQALGLTMTERDTDAAIGDRKSTEPITEHQAANLQAMAEDVGANIPVFLKYMGVAAFEKIPKARHAEAVEALEKKRRQS